MLPLLSKRKSLKAKSKRNFKHLFRVCSACVILVAVVVTSFCGNNIRVLQEISRRW